MARFSVSLLITRSITIEVEAESEEQAMTFAVLRAHKMSEEEKNSLGSEEVEPMEVTETT